MFTQSKHFYANHIKKTFKSLKMFLHNISRLGLATIVILGSASLAITAVTTDNNEWNYNNPEVELRKSIISRALPTTRNLVQLMLK